MSARPPSQSPPDSEGSIRVLVVDDSAAQRGMLMSLLAADRAIEVIGWAANGVEAIAATARLRPDLVVMDLRMPVMDGLEATRRIMRETPVPIVVVTASHSSHDQKLVFESIQAGALAILEKPRPGVDGAPTPAELVRTVKSMARVRVIRRWAPERLRPPVGEQRLGPARTFGLSVEVIAIAASTGGPQALQAILSHLPASFPVPLLIVQHITAGFVSGLVEWLRLACALPVELAAEAGPFPRPGVYVAPTDRHLIVRGRALALTSDPPVSGHRPSATVLFRSVARAYGPAAAGVILTGMGDDGAAGMRDLKRARGITVAQDEATSIVFGMPAEAIGLGIVDHVVPLGGVAAFLIDLAGATPGMGETP